MLNTFLIVWNTTLKMSKIQCYFKRQLLIFFSHFSVLVSLFFNLLHTLLIILYNNYIMKKITVLQILNDLLSTFIVATSTHFSPQFGKVL